MKTMWKNYNFFLSLFLFKKYRGQLQILLQIELYLIENLNVQTNKVRIDDDWIWEIANVMRWLSQVFKDKFKIEKYLFSEIYANYFAVAPEFILNLMEELGYDKEDQLSTQQPQQTQSPKASSQTTSPIGSTASSNKQQRTSLTSSEQTNTEKHQQHQVNHSFSSNNDSMVSNYTVLFGVDSLFEEENDRNDSDAHDTSNNNGEEASQSQKATFDQDDPLNSFIKKKT